ncbi:MAG: hypothetical protein C4522_12890 [Desulfobacteraceae bacterium]|nr:MAG: hypothetical protein C4522_12890 [Desulfobacteraceae bacterium]
MKFRTVFQFMTAFLALSVTATVLAGDSMVFGPETFTINKWHVNLSCRTFRSDEPGEGRITIRKNTPDMNISSGFLIFNWRFVPLTEFFNGDELVLDMNVAAKSLNSLTIFLSGKPGASVSVTVLKQDEMPLLPVIEFSSNPAGIVSGEPVLLTWHTEHAETCGIEPGIGPVGTSGSMTVVPSETTMYTLTAEGPGGISVSTATVTVISVPVAEIASEKSALILGESTLLSWSSEHADQVIIEPGIGPVSPSGSIPVSPETNTRYVITAQGPGGTATANTTITIISLPPAIEFNAGPAVIPRGGSAVLTWNCVHADSCVIQPDIGTVDTNGSFTVTPQSTTTYRLTASGTGGTTSAERTITVNQPPAIVMEKPDQTTTQADDICPINWRDSDPDDNAVISLYYDTDNIGANGVLIVTGIREDHDEEGDDAYIWDTVDIPEGNYHIYARIEDSINAPVIAYSGGMVAVSHPSSIPEAVLTAGDADEGDYFGESVAICGNTALIGASGDDEGGEDAGAIYVFLKEQSGWIQESKILPDDLAAGDHFGAAIAVDGNLAVVGAYGKQNNRGAAYVFVRDGEEWNRQAILMADDGMENDYFGSVVSISKGFIIAGAYGRNISGPNTGAAYIFQLVEKNWIQTARLSANAGASGDYFGGSVAIHQNIALVGAPGTDQAGMDSGKAYVYQYDGSTWMLQAELDSPDGASGDYFGTAVSLNQDFLMIGATGAETAGEAVSGAVYTFYHNGKQWVQTQKITAGIPENNGLEAAFFKKPFSLNRLMADMTPWYLIPFMDRFGGKIIMDDKIAAIRTMREYGASRIKIVRSVIEKPDEPNGNTIWKPVAVISTGNAQEPDVPGQAMDMEDGRLIVGFPGKDGDDIDTGEVKIYKLPVSTEFQEKKLTAVDCNEQDMFGAAVAADENRLIIGAPYDESSGVSSGAAYIFGSNNGEWIRQAVLTANDAGNQDEFGISVDMEGDFAIVGASRKQINGAVVGAAYIFQNIEGTWTRTAMLYGDELTEEAWFGSSVSISNGFAVVGAPNENEGTGAAYVFHFNGTFWERHGKLQKDRELAMGGDYFADSVSLDGNRLIIGVPGENGRQGAIRFFHFDGNNWIGQTTINGSAHEFFGENVSLYGDYAIAGRAGDNNDSGAAYIYQWDGADWTEAAELISGENFPEARFGTSVAITDQYAMVGSVNKSPVSGSAFIYQNDKGSWRSMAKTAADDTDVYHAFGSSVAIAGENFITGSSKNYTVNEFGGSEQDFCGAAYIHTQADTMEETDSTVSISATPGIVLQGESVTLTWRGVNVSSCTITPDIGAVDIEDSIKIFPDKTTTYTITAQGPDGTIQDSVTISVVAGETPSATLNISPSTFHPGESVTLSWGTENAVSCTIDQNIGAVDLSGTMMLKPIGTTTYTITATGLNGNTSASATAALDQTPSVQLSASADTVVKGGNVTLQWTSINADTAYIPGIGGVPVNGGAVITLYETATFTITATGPEGTATDSVTVTAIDPVPTVSIIAVPESIYPGESTALGWLSEHADTVVMEPGFGEVLLNGSRIVHPTETTTYTVTATGPGGTAVASIIVEVKNPIELNITSPAEGETVTRPDALVQGTFTHAGNLETGIVINGVPAMIFGNRFAANHVPLMSGEETIRVTATDTRGISNTKSLFFNMDVADHTITINANPESGLSPLESSLTIDGTFSIMDSTITESDPPTVEYLESNPDNYKVIVTGRGFYYFTATVNNPEGGTCSDTIAVLAQDQDEFDAMLRAKWDGMKNALKYGNIETALGFMEKSKRAMYDYNFNLLKDHLPEIEAGMQDLAMVNVHDRMAEYSVKGEQGGRQFSFYVLFVKDSDGIWRISFF